LNAWKQFPTQIFDKEQLSLLKSLVDPLKLVESISELQGVQESMSKMAIDF